MFGLSNKPEPTPVTIDITARNAADVEKLFTTPRQLYGEAIAAIERHMEILNRLLEQERRLKRPADRAAELRRQIEELDTASRTTFEAWLRTSVGEAPRADAGARRRLQDELAIVVDEAAANEGQLISVAREITEAQRRWEVLAKERHDAWIGCIIAEVETVKARRREKWLECAALDAAFTGLCQVLRERNAAGAVIGLVDDNQLLSPEERFQKKEPHRLKLAALVADARSKARSWALAIEAGDVECVLEVGTGEAT